MNIITEAENEVERLGGLILASEDWAKGYKKNKESFTKLIKLETKIERAMRGYLRTLAKERIGKYINWDKYSADKVKAYNLNVTVDVQEIDDTEYDELLNVLHDPLVLSIALGAQTAQTEYNIDLGLNQYNSDILQAAQTYTAKLVKGINQTTVDRIQQSINTSLHLGEDVSDASARLARIIGDPSRATTIARTETVRSYTQGILTFGQKSGATQKVWELSSAPCEICQGNYDSTPNSDGVLDINDDFSDGDPPAHPNCRCGLSLVHDYSDPEDDSGLGDDSE